MNEDSPLIPLSEAITKYKIPLPKLVGRIMRGDLDDPIGGMVAGEAYVIEDWRLKRLADNSRASTP